MRTYLDCYPCFLRQALEAARMAGADKDQQYRVLQEVLNELGRFKLTSTPPEMAYRIHQLVRQEMGGRDPYLQAKCPVIARNLKVPVKSIVLKQGDFNFGKREAV